MMTDPNFVHRENILGVGLSPISMSQTLHTMKTWIENGKKHYICVTPVHSIMDCYQDESLKVIFNKSGLTTPDGMPLVWILRWKGHKNVDRVYGPSLMLEACEQFQPQGYRHFFFGSTPEVQHKLISNLHARLPNLEIAGHYAPPYENQTPDDHERSIERINHAQPTILWVALGAPQQERWMAEHIGKITAPVMIGVGAAFDFISGHKKQAPPWMRRSGTEWLFRLVQEPNRLWPRYRLYPRFVFLITLQLLGLRKFPINTNR
jgi:N-acetylglucosaminyldiphosphoundecaprenol N-acetyl-beta-D-mannosaminyltransferase